MKLNNKGWGLTNLIVFIGIFIIVLLAIAFLAYRYGIEENTENAVGRREQEIWVAP